VEPLRKSIKTGWSSFTKPGSAAPSTVELPTFNVQLPTPKSKRASVQGAFFLRPAVLMLRDENPDEFVGFIDQRPDPLSVGKWHSLDQRSGSMLEVGR
jgi:hypothetical protein